MFARRARDAARTVEVQIDARRSRDEQLLARLDADVHVAKFLKANIRIKRDVCVYNYDEVFTQLIQNTITTTSKCIPYQNRISERNCTCGGGRILEILLALCEEGVLKNKKKTNKNKQPKNKQTKQTNKTNKEPRNAAPTSRRTVGDTRKDVLFNAARRIPRLKPSARTQIRVERTN